jgi:thiamine-monophosphate kinase
MPLGEFDIIDRYFRRPLRGRDDVVVGIGDDGAVLRVPDGHTVVTAAATLGDAAWADREGDGARLGHDVMTMALAPLLSAGARPAWATLALTIPEADAHWLTAFSDGLFAVAEAHSVVLVGGDTTRGPFTVTVVGHGLLAPDAGRPGDSSR